MYLCKDYNVLFFAFFQFFLIKIEFLFQCNRTLLFFTFKHYNVIMFLVDKRKENLICQSY